jgi:hypothetical protein
MNNNITQYLNLINPCRFGTHKQLFEIACILYSIMDNEQDAVNLVIEYTQKNNSKYTTDQIIKLFQRINRKNYKVNSLYYICKNDNPSGFKKLNKITPPIIDPADEFIDD